HDFMGFKSESGLLSGSCNLDVVCGEEDGWGIVDQYRDIIQSVANMSINGSTFCTGFLVNNVRQDCTPLFMTANHCDNLNANSAPSLVVYWNYVNSFCRQPGSTASGNNGNGSFNDFNSGSIFRAAYGPSDMKLVELDDEVSASADAFFAGWDAREFLPSDTLICVHHPSNDEKRISFQFNGAYRGTWANDDLPVPSGDHLIIDDWEIGTTEGGSSGSPLFNAQKQVVGQLHGGLAACGNMEYDSYGWMATSWEGGGTPSTSLRPWLDPDNTGLLVLDGRTQTQCEIIVTIDQPVRTVCGGEVVTYNVSVSDAFQATVDLTINNLPSSLTASFSDNTISPGQNTQLTVSGTENVPTDTYLFTISGNDGTNESIQSISLSVDAGVPAIPTLVSPANLSSGQPIIVLLNWVDAPSRVSYSVELATDPSFSTTIANPSGLSESSFVTPNLTLGTTYYWRVRASNTCGNGAWSPPFQFQTGTLACGLNVANTAGLTIGPGAGTVTTSTLSVTQEGSISLIRLTDFSTNHTYTGDLIARLIAPSGTSVQLFNLPDCVNGGMLVSFDDAAVATYNQFNNTCDPNGEFAIEGTFQPLESLNTFLDEEANGTWRLEITDNFNGDEGQLLGWGLEICVVQASITPSSTNILSCPGNLVNLQLALGEGFEDNVDLSTNNLPAGVSVNFSSNTVNPGSIVDVEVSGLDDLGDYPIEFVATDGDNTTTSLVNIAVVLAPAASILQSPADQSEITGSNAVTFSWMAAENTEYYTVEVATDAAFEDIVADNTTAALSLAIELDNGAYFWRVISANDCGESISESATFSFTPTSSTYLNGVDIDIWPNPSRGPIQISLSGRLPGDLDIDLFSASGQQVRRFQLPAISGTQTLDLGDLPSGIYLLRLINGSQQMIRRLVVE
ncbi:MAG: proprotein convertase P-domain-containing protein, partial [Bacteroidota bacterium]